MKEEWTHLNTVLDRFTESGILTGCGMRIFKDGEMIYDRCTGVSTADGSRAFTADT